MHLDHVLTEFFSSVERPRVLVVGIGQDNADDIEYTTCASRPAEIAALIEALQRRRPAGLEADAAALLCQLRNRRPKCGAFTRWA